MNFQIDKDIFEYFPGMRVVTVLAKGFHGKENAEKIDELLNDAWQNAAAAASQYGNPQSHPNIKPWGERMKTVGAPRKKYPCAVEALVRRAGKSPTPFRISPVVDFYNAISLKHLVPAGGFDIDQLNEDMMLRFSEEGDTFQALDSDAAVAVPQGEVSYTDGSIIITRHFIWKQARHTLLTEDSRNILFVSEILEELPESTAETVGGAIKDGLLECFGVESTVKILDVDDNVVEL